MKLTYRELIENLKDLPDEHLDDTVTVFVSSEGEFYPLVDDYPFATANMDIYGEFIPGAQDGVLDDGHPYLVI